MPARCACCAEAADTLLPVVGARIANGRSSTRVWSFPFCARCADHVERAPSVRGPTALLLTLLTWGLFLIAWLRQRGRARTHYDGRCASATTPVSYIGWKGSEQHFDVASPSFAFAFMQANREKLTNVSPEAHALLAQPPRLPPLPLPPQEMLPAQPAQRQVARDAAAASAPPPRPVAAVVSPPPSIADLSAPPLPRPMPVAAPARAVVEVVVRAPTAVATPRPLVRFVVDEPVEVMGRRLLRPLTYVGQADALHLSAIRTDLPVGNPATAVPLPLFASYASASPEQRARYLDWLAGGRVDPDVDIGCVLLFFYGLERRLFIDGQDRAPIRQEVDRLFGLYAGRSTAFRQHGTELLAFDALRRWTELDDAAAEDQLGALAGESVTALIGTLAWHQQRRRPLPARHASVVMLASNEAKHGVVVQRSARELLDLFALRYRERHGDGIVLEALARPTTIDYHPAGSAMLFMGQRVSVRLPDVLGARKQWNALVGIWNACVDDLKRTNSAKKKAGGELTAEAWAALPPDLRAQYDHPDQERWERLLAQAEPAGRFGVTTLGKVAETAHLSADRMTPAQLRKLGELAALLGVAVEPELRLAHTAQLSDAPLLVWRSDQRALPDANMYGAATSVMALATSIAHADGAKMDDEEQRVVTRIIEDLFQLDDGLRTRLAAHLEWLQRRPANAAAFARKLQASLQPEQLGKLGRLLVAVAAADGTVSRAEHAALERLYKSLGLPSAELAAALVASEARLENDDTVAMQPGTRGAAGEAIPPPPGETPRLNQRAIEAILADTREVAAMLSAVLDDGVDDPPPAPAVSVDPGGLDSRYQGVLQELLAKPMWRIDEVRSLSLKAQLMPGAILETINGWSDASYGDYLIDDRGDWHIRAELLRRPTA